MISLSPSCTSSLTRPGMIPSGVAEPSERWIWSPRRIRPSALLRETSFPLQRSRQSEGIQGLSFVRHLVNEFSPSHSCVLFFRPAPAAAECLGATGPLCTDDNPGTTLYHARFPECHRPQ